MGCPHITFFILIFGFAVSGFNSSDQNIRFFNILNAIYMHLNCGVGGGTTEEEFQDALG